jgi:hypothetical protein
MMIGRMSARSPFLLSGRDVRCMNLGRTLSVPYDRVAGDFSLLKIRTHPFGQRTGEFYLTSQVLNRLDASI